MGLSNRQIEQRARREAQAAVSAKRQERLAKEKRLEALAVAVTAAMAQRRELDRLVGETLLCMTKSEGLDLREAVGWCDLITIVEARRLRAAVLVERSATADE